MADPFIPNDTGMDPAKYRFLQKIQEEIPHLSQDEILPFFLAIQKKAEHDHIQFTPEETNRLIESFRSQANETEKKELDLLLQLIELRK